MSRDGSGNYTRVPGSAYANGTTADGSELEAEINDIATALTQSISKDGQTVPTANLPMGGYKHTNVNTASARTEYARASQVQDGTLAYLTSVSGADTITASAPIGLSAYAAGQEFSFVSAGANTGAVTLNINAIGAKSVTKDGTTALAAGDIASGAVCVVVYDGTQFQLVSSRGVPSASETVAGVVELATTAEATAGTDTARAVTAAGVSAAISAAFPLKHIAGLIVTNNSTDAANDIDVSAGQCVDSTGDYLLNGTALTKRLDATFTAGTNQGGLDTGTAASNTWYYIWAIRKDSDATVDYLISTSSSSPTMPSGYTYKRLISARKTKTSVAEWEPVLAHETAGGGEYVAWVDPTLDVALATTLGASARSDAIRVPPIAPVRADVNVGWNDASNAQYVYIYTPGMTDMAPNLGASPLAAYRLSSTTAETLKTTVITNSSSQIRLYASSTLDDFRLVTLGYEWGRR